MKSKGPCGWAKDGIPCTHYGHLKKGFCEYHYAVLNQGTQLYWCHCIVPIPKQAVIFGKFTLTDVHECERCGLAILT